MDSAEEREILERVLATGEEAPEPMEQLRLLAHLHEHGSEAAKRRAAEAMVMRIASLARHLHEARDTQEKLAQIVEHLTTPPWHPWVFRGVCPTSRGDEAVVSRAGTTRIVGAADDVDLGELLVGDEVFLGQEMNMIMARSPWGPPVASSPSEAVCGP